MSNYINNVNTENLQHLVDGQRFSIPEARAFLDTEGDILLLFPRYSYPYVTGLSNEVVRKQSKKQGLNIIPLPFYFKSIQGIPIEILQTDYNYPVVEEVVI